jgi:hypothetical protein
MVVGADYPMGAVVGIVRQTGRDERRARWMSERS